MIITILDYSNGKVNILSGNTDNIETLLKEKGYNLNNISYMITDKLNLNINI